MPEWREIVRDRLSGLALPPADEIGIVEELAQHLEDCYREARSHGLTEPEAMSRSLDELDDRSAESGLRDLAPRA